MTRTVFKVTITLLIISLMAAMFGCSETREMKKYTAYAVCSDEKEGGESITVTGLNYYENDPGPFYEPKEKTIKISFLGSDYEAEFFESVPGRISGVSYTYLTPEKDIIEISSAGEILSFTSRLCRTYWRDDYNCSDEEAEKIKARAVENATKWAEEIYGDDLDFEYTPRVNSQIDSNMVKVRFRAKTDSDNELPYRLQPGGFTFEMTIDGELLNFYSSANMGKFKGKSVPADFTLEKVREIVNNMIEDGDIELQCDVDGSEDKRFNVFPLTDGRLVCQTYVYVNGDTENRIEVIIPLE